MKKCELCSAPAKMYCNSDQAILCWDCDSRVHTANILVTKHVRTLLCHVCQSPTPWTGSGPRLAPSVSVCPSCVALKVPIRRNDNTEDDRRRRNDDGNDNDNHHEDDDDDDDEGENQVVPLSNTLSSGSSSSMRGESSDSVDPVSGSFLSTSDTRAWSGQRRRRALVLRTSEIHGRGET